MAAKVAEEWLNICGGCEVSILDIGEPLLDLLPQLQFVHMPVLMDHKYFGAHGRGHGDGDSAGGRGHHQRRRSATRKRNTWPRPCARVVRPSSPSARAPASAASPPWRTCGSGTTSSTRSTATPRRPRRPRRRAKTCRRSWTRSWRLDEVVKVDAYIPGCPTAPELIVQALTALLSGKPFTLPERSVCDDCPVKREKKASGGTLKRPLEDCAFKQGEPWENTRCLMEQGYLCLGPVTRSGCGAGTEAEGHTKVPRCIKGYMPCRGCFGPIRKGANPLVDMMGALTSHRPRCQAGPGSSRALQPLHRRAEPSPSAAPETRSREVTHHV